MSVSIRPLVPELVEKARVELHEDPKKLEDGLQHLKEWLAKQPHLNARKDDQWLATFLRGCKHSLERTKEKIDLYYTINTIAAKDLHPLSHRDPKFKEILKRGIFLALPKSEKVTDPRVFLIRSGEYTPDEYTIGEVMSAASVVQRIMYKEDDEFIVNGGVSILDFKNCTLAHMTAMTPSFMKKMVVAGQEAAPIRMKGAHYVNTMAGFETVFNVAKSFLNEKNKNRLHVHGKEYSALYNYVSKEVLPVEYGGNGGTLQEITDYWVKKVEDNSDWLDEDEKFGTDESKRPGKPKTAEDMFGVDGSFRQLEFD